MAFGYSLIGLTAAIYIAGILGFMLTPDGWPWQGTFWSAFFNPTFLPQLLFRVAAGYVLGGLLTLTFLAFTRREAAFRAEALGFFGKVILIAAALALVGVTWYFASVPPAFRVFSIFSIVTSNLSQVAHIFWVVNALMLLGIIVTAAFAWRKSPRVVRVMVIPAVILMMGFFTEFERAREFVRGPYIMPGYMYANQVLMKEAPYFSQQGVLANSYWFNAASPQSELDQGLYLFGQNCSVCHTLGGINDIQSKVRGRSQDGIAVLVAHNHDMVPFMAPFSGTPEERLTLAKFLFLLGSNRLQVDYQGRFLNVKMVETIP